MSISVGLVGLGQFGSAFADMFMSHPLVSRVALCDREPDRIEKFAKKESWAKKFNPADAYESLDDICKSDLDALVIITQPWLHAPQCIQAMESGKNVYSAVPIISIPDGDEILQWCDKLVETCRKTGMHYMLGETTYYRPEGMYCRRRAEEGAFGDFVYAEGEYLHPFDNPHSDLRKVQEARTSSKSGKEWLELARKYADRGVKSGPMHYPTHSISGPMCVMKAHALKVSACGYATKSDEPYLKNTLFSNETALFQMSNGTAMRVCEFREIAVGGRETFRVYGSKGSYEHRKWVNQGSEEELSVEDMRDPMPDDVVEAFKSCSKKSDFYGGHGGSHAYLVHEFVDAIANRRTPAINVWEAVRYMAAGVMAHKSAQRGGELLDVPDWGDAP